MTLTFKHVIAAILLMSSLAAQVAAGPSENGNATYTRRDYTTALRFAEQGNVDAERDLAFMYVSGSRGAPQDYAEAYKWFRKAAEQGDAISQHIVGIRYFNGDGVPRDYTEATKWFKKSADQGTDYDQYQLGTMYLDGQGVPKDDAMAAMWFRKAAEQGHVTSQTLLGLMYFDGQGVEQNYAEAAKWSRLAADRGDALAQNKLGLMYFKGEGVPQDYAAAHMWFNLAAAQDHHFVKTEAVQNRNIIERRMTTAQIAEAQKLAREWKPIK